MSINQSNINRSLLPFSTILQGAIPSDSGLFETGASNYQVEQPKSTNEDGKQLEQDVTRVITGSGTLTSLLNFRCYYSTFTGVILTLCGGAK